jgi:hypothetical protein
LRGGGGEGKVKSSQSQNEAHGKTEKRNESDGNVIGPCEEGLKAEREGKQGINRQASGG